MNLWWQWLRYINYDCREETPGLSTLPSEALHLCFFTTEHFYEPFCLCDSTGLMKSVRIFSEGKGKAVSVILGGFFTSPFGTKAVILYLIDLSRLTHSCRHHANLGSCLPKALARSPSPNGITRMVHKLTYFNNFNIFNLMLPPLFYRVLYRRGITAQRG